MSDTHWHPPYQYGYDVHDNNEDDEAIVLTRFCYSSMGTFGILTYKDFKCYTVELPWRENQKRISCIPEYDNYMVEFYDSPKFGRTLAITGGTVALFEDNEHQRFAILFHVANTIDDILGCIGCGRALGFIKNKWAVLYSSSTTNEFLSKVPQDKKTRLVIKQYIPSEENII